MCVLRKVSNVFCKHISNQLPWAKRYSFLQKRQDDGQYNRVCCTPVDMCQGFLRLCQFVRSNDFNPSDSCVYVFYDRSRNLLKLLHQERCGFVMYHKQMAQGCLSGKIMQQPSGFYELRWDELVLYIVRCKSSLLAQKTLS